MEDVRAVIRQISSVYEGWLRGDLSQEDALFAIGDVLREQKGQGSRFEPPPAEQGPRTG